MESRNITIPEERVYIHEVIEIDVKHKPGYMAHFMSWAEISWKLYGMRLIGVWAINGSTHRWPEALVLWELDGVAAFARMMSGEYAFLSVEEMAGRDHYNIFWDHAPEGVRETRGINRLLAPTRYSPSLAGSDLRGKPAVAYLHETYTGPQGRINEVLADLGNRWVPVARKYGCNLVGAYRSMLLNDNEAIVIWSFAKWDDWIGYELALHSDPEFIAWRSHLAGNDIGIEGRIMHAAAGIPLEQATTP